MRLGQPLVALVLFAAACHGSSSSVTPPPPPSLAVHLVFGAPATTPGNLQVAAAGLHLQALTAVSDRSAADPRARLSDLDLAMGGTVDDVLSPAPPGLYSSVNLILDGPDGIGVDLAGAWGQVPLHVQLRTDPFGIACAAPVRLDPGQRLQLALRADPGRWFDGIDLSKAVSDADDDGILLSEDDNHAIAVGVRANVIASFALDCALAP
jgi:hypothetical protein